MHIMPLTLASTSVSILHCISLHYFIQDLLTQSFSDHRVTYIFEIDIVSIIPGL